MGTSFYTYLWIISTMKKSSMANLDYTLIVEELQPLVGRFFEKFYELDKGLFRLKFGRDSLILELPTRLHKTKYIEAAPEASSFAMKVRKELKGRKLKSLTQHGKDRVIIFDFEGTVLIAEMFGKGNLLLLRDGKILSMYLREKRKERELRVGAQYNFPPTQTKELGEILASKSPKPIGFELRALDIGMSYVRALLVDAELADSKPLDQLTKSETEAIETSYKKLMKSPLKFSKLTNGEEGSSLSESLDEYYGAPVAAQVGEIQKNKEIEKLERLLKHQEEKLTELSKKEEDAKKNGDLIYEHYEAVEKILDLYKSGGLAKIEKLAKEKNWKLDKKEKTLEF